MTDLEQFEAWAAEHIAQPRFSGGIEHDGRMHYTHPFVQNHWLCWQAARAAPAQGNVMRCDFCNVNFADRQPGSLCPKCYRELSLVRAAPTQPEIDQEIDRLWGDSGHGTRRIDIERAVHYGMSIGQGNK
jgi:hypothetical protein